ncbi:DUF1648 domain-containing protein [Micromonospora sp. DT81.3]|uniref:DUF1648 domain-containing protein n=1 Tax=Micromonospora sp. DT81.3 TaxID=3416523 RepID=UPI003CF9CD50
MTTDHRPDRNADRAAGRFALVAVLLPAWSIIAALVIQLAALPSLPDPAATHWGASGGPDGFGPSWIFPLLTVLLGLGVPALIAAALLPGLRRGERGPTYRFMGAFALGLAVFLAVGLTGAVLMQAGLADAADAPAVWPALLLAAGLGALAGIAGWFLQPHQEWPLPRGTLSTLDLAPGERAVWLSTTSLSLGAAAGIGLAVVALVGTAVVVWLSGGVLVAVVVTLAAALVAGLAATTIAFHLRVDDAGLTARSALGWPVFRVPLTDIASASAVQVNPMGEFGGWGLRFAPGRFGIVLRAGEGVEILRANGKRVVVTADDATTGAALLQTLASQRA